MQGIEIENDNICPAISIVDKKINLSEIAIGAGKSAAEMFSRAKDKTVQFIDQNDDGKFNGSDVAETANVVGEAAKKKVNNLKDTEQFI